MENEKYNPPKLAEKLLSMSLDINDRDMLLGDFEEFYLEKIQELAPSTFFSDLMWAFKVNSNQERLSELKRIDVCRNILEELDGP